MASRRFFDPYDYYYTTPYPYSSYPYYTHAPARNDSDFFFPDADSPLRPAAKAAARPSPSAYYHRPAPARAPERRDDDLFPGFPIPEPSVRASVPRSSRSISVPVHFAGSESELGSERETAGFRVPPPAPMAPTVANKKREPSAEVAAVRVQAAARGFMARKMLREVRAVEREAEVVAARVVAEAEALRGDARARVAVVEELMRLLLRLDAVRGVREYRRRVTKRVLALQDAVDALEHKPAPVIDMPAAEDTFEAQMAEEDHVEEETEMALGLPHASEQGVKIGSEIAAEYPAVDTAAEMELDGGRSTVDEVVSTVDEAADPAVTEQVVNNEKVQEAEGEWEMVTEEGAVTSEKSAPKAEQPEPAGEEEDKKTEGGAADGLDARKVMEMVAALCERSAQQCALIGALAERVDTLERSVRRVEEAERRRRRNKKLKKEGNGKGKAARSCYSD